MLKKISRFAALFLILTGLLNTVSASSQGLDVEDPQTVYLPLIMSRYPGPTPTYGVETEVEGNVQIFDKASDADMYWVRRGAFSWAEIEPVRKDPPEYNWDVVANQDLEDAAARGLKIIGMVRYTPSWAQKTPGSFCGPVAPEALDEFAQFMAALVTKYGNPPYNIKYWEMGNEPDVAPELVPPDSHFGCWGDSSDYYYGGRYYAEMLKHIYPAVKAADPQAKIMNGGLLLFCDPANPPDGHNCVPSRFLAGIFENQGADHLDIVSYHAYGAYSGKIYDIDHPVWEHRGGIIMGKTDFIREVMVTYQVDKPLMITETSLATYEDTVTPEFLEAQADFVVWMYTRMIAEKLLGAIWFTIEGPGWYNTGLFYDDGYSEKPAYNSYKFMTGELKRAEYEGPVTIYPGLTGYAFNRFDVKVWVLWDLEQVGVTITIPANTLRVLDKYGNELTPENGQIFVNSPVYIELSP